MRFLWDFSQCHSSVRLLCVCGNSTLLLSVDLRACLCCYPHFANGETWDIGRDSDWLRSAHNVKARNTILLLWVLSLIFSVLHDAMISENAAAVSGVSFPGAVTPGCPLSLTDLQSSYYRLDLNKELGQGCLTDTLVRHVHTLRMGPFQEQECSIISDFPFPNWGKR